MQPAYQTIQPVVDFKEPSFAAGITIMNLYKFKRESDKDTSLYYVDAAGDKKQIPDDDNAAQALGFADVAGFNAVLTDEKKTVEHLLKFMPNTVQAERLRHNTAVATIIQIANAANVGGANAAAIAAAVADRGVPAAEDAATAAADAAAAVAAIKNLKRTNQALEGKYHPKGITIPAENTLFGAGAAGAGVLKVNNFNPKMVLSIFQALKIYTQNILRVKNGQHLYDQILKSGILQNNLTTNAKSAAKEIVQNYLLPLALFLDNSPAIINKKRIEPYVNPNAPAPAAAPTILSKLNKRQINVVSGKNLQAHAIIASKQKQRGGVFNIKFAGGAILPFTIPSTMTGGALTASNLHINDESTPVHDFYDKVIKTATKVLKTKNLTLDPASSGEVTKALTNLKTQEEKVKVLYSKLLSANLLHGTEAGELENPVSESNIDRLIEECTLLDKCIKKSQKVVGAFNDVLHKIGLNV